MPLTETYLGPVIGITIQKDVHALQALSEDGGAKISEQVR
jgi:hypothetical protein